MDTVELVMAIEDEFSIKIPDRDAEKLAVLGEIHDYVVAALRQRGETPDESQVWRRLSSVVIAQLGVRPEEVTRAAFVKTRKESGLTLFRLYAPLAPTPTSCRLQKAMKQKTLTIPYPSC